MKAIDNGYVQQEIQDAAYAYQQAVERDEQIVVGVNKFVTDEEAPIETLRVDPEIERRQVAALKLMRERRDNGKVSELLTQIETAAQGSENLLPLFIEAVEREATLGEICMVLRGVFGEYHPDARI